MKKFLTSERLYLRMFTNKDIEIGYRLHKKFWGMGYAAEMTTVLVDYGFDVLEVKKYLQLQTRKIKTQKKY